MRLKTILKSFSAPTLALSIETLMQHSRWHLVPLSSVWSVGPFVSQTVTEISKSKTYQKTFTPRNHPLLSQENVKTDFAISLLEMSSRATRHWAYVTVNESEIWKSPEGFKQTPGEEGLLHGTPPMASWARCRIRGGRAFISKINCVVLIHTYTQQATSVACWSKYWRVAYWDKLFQVLRGHHNYLLYTWTLVDSRRHELHKFSRQHTI